MILLYTISLGLVSLYISSYYISFSKISQNISEKIYPIHKRIEQIKEIEDVIKLLQFLAKRNPTEDVADKIVNNLNKYGLSDNTIQRLSRMHMKYASDYGVKGYAINMLWSCVVLHNSSE